MTPRLEIKICGLTRPDEAAAGAAAGADAIGLVFHPASPRHLDPARARAIVDALPPGGPGHLRWFATPRMLRRLR